jgi:hypothetical protein
MSYRHLFDNSASWRTAQRLDLRHGSPGTYELSLAAQGAVGVRCSAVTQHQCQDG